MTLAAAIRAALNPGADKLRRLQAQVDALLAREAELSAGFLKSDPGAALLAEWARSQRLAIEAEILRRTTDTPAQPGQERLF